MSEMTTTAQGLNFRTIDRLDSISSEEFKRTYLLHNRPVVINNFSESWKARNRWTPDFFMDAYGDNQVKVYDMNFGTPGKKYMSNLKTMSLKEYLSLMIQGKTTLRMFLYNIIKEAPELKDDVELPTIMKGFSKNFMFMFFGAQGSITQMHYDIDMSHVFHTAFTGKKRFYLYPPSESKRLYRHPFTIRSYVDVLNPDFERYPNLKNAVGDYVELQPGETLFIPAGYWHHVVYDEPSVALSLRCAHQKFGKRLEGFFNILVMQLVDRLVNKISPIKWYQWKERRAKLLAQS
jgi:ribosomal protein L16 Arg81 hydroxylase